MVECTAAFLSINHSSWRFLQQPLKVIELSSKANAFLRSLRNALLLSFCSRCGISATDQLGYIWESLTSPSSAALSHLFVHVAQMDVQRGGIREHEARKPVVLMLSPWSFDLASGQLPLISVLVDDY